MSKLRELKTSAEHEVKNEKLQELQEELQLYERDVGFEHSCFVMREHGPELSLMTEIVYGQTRGKLFPVRSEQAFDSANKVA